MPTEHVRGPQLDAVTYAGTIPCASCPGIRIVLTLFPDSTFRMRQTYLEAEGGQDKDFYDLGRWARAEDGLLRLRDGTEGPQQFRFLAGGVLRMFDTEGNEVRSDLNYDLTRQPEVDPVSGQ
ncbi:MAG: copper resistance protein NlpE [Burkholderiales bacterium]